MPWRWSPFATQRGLAQLLEVVAQGVGAGDVAIDGLLGHAGGFGGTGGEALGLRRWRLVAGRL